ncbi:MAG TPA: hypothetical protein PLD74_10690 [Prolixibacteraceae bacterium]|nr:hypothetical protein [Prolixibacteraceae bacterium]
MATRVNSRFLGLNRQGEELRRNDYPAVEENNGEGCKRDIASPQVTHRGCLNNIR